MAKKKDAPSTEDTNQGQESADAEAAANAERLKAEEKAEAKALAEAKKAEAAELKKAEKAEKAAAAAEAKEKLKAEKEAAKQAKLAEKEASKMPESNGVRRPKASSLCGKCWAIFDELSAKTGAPATIGEALKISEPQGLNPATMHTQYARWRKFFAVSGRTVKPAAPAEA